jgi:hypothetical protein
MSRYFTAFIALILLLGLAVGVYGRFFYTPPALAVAPVFVATKPLTKSEKFEELAKTDPVEMLSQCLTRYQSEIKDGFKATLIKKERPRGNPAPPAEPREEVISLFVRGDVPDPPDAQPCVEVLMRWQSGADTFLGSEIRGTFYSDKPGDAGTSGKIRIWRPEAPFSKLNSIPANDATAQDSSRYCIRDAGVYRAMLRCYEAWKQRKEAGTLRTEYLGKQVIEKAGGRLCYVVRRTCPTPEVDVDPFEVGGVADRSPENVARVGFTSVTLMIDVDTWLQVGTVLQRKEADGKSTLIGSYYFRDLDLHPQFAPGTFTEAGLKAKK